MIWHVRPSRYTDESESGYFYRLAEANGFNSSKGWQMASQGESIDVSRDKNSGAADNRFILVDHQRVCPICLEENPYLRAAWDHVLLPTCYTHNVELVSCCPTCHIPLRRAPGRMIDCICGQHLPYAPSIEAKPTDVERLLATKLNHTSGVTFPQLPKELIGLTGSDLLKLVLLIGAYQSFDGGDRPRKAPLKADPSIPRAILSHANGVLSDWPNNFQSMLRGACLKRPAETELKKVFGHFYKALYTELDGVHFQFVRDAFENWIRQEWQGLLTKRHRRFDQSTQALKRIMSKTAVRRQTRTPSKDLSVWVARGELKGSIRKLPSGRTSVLIEANQEGKIALLANRQDLQQASKSLQIPENRLRELFEAKLIEGQPPVPGGCWRIHISEIQRTLSLIKNLPLVGSDQSVYLKLDSVLRYKLDARRSAASFFAAILGGDITCRRLPINEKKGFASILVCKASLENWLRRQMSGLTIPELAKHLNIKQEVAYHLVRTNVIQATDSGRLGVFVELSAIEAFIQMYAWARDIAKNLRTSPRSLVARLNSVGVDPVSGPSIDGSRQYLYLRRDVGHYFDSEVPCQA